MAQNLTATRASVTKRSIGLWFKEISDYFAQSGTVFNEPEIILMQLSLLSSLLLKEV